MEQNQQVERKRKLEQGIRILRDEIKKSQSKPDNGMHLTQTLKKAGLQPVHGTVLQELNVFQKEGRDEHKQWKYNWTSNFSPEAIATSLMKHTTAKRAEYADNKREAENAKKRAIDDGPRVMGDHYEGDFPESDYLHSDFEDQYSAEELEQMERDAQAQEDSELWREHYNLLSEKYNDLLGEHNKLKVISESRKLQLEAIERGELQQVTAEDHEDLSRVLDQMVRRDAEKGIQKAMLQDAVFGKEQKSPVNVEINTNKREGTTQVIININSI